MVAALNAARALAAQPMPTPTASSPYITDVPFNSGGGVGNTPYGPSTTVTVNQTTNASPQSTATAVVNAIKFSQSQSLNLYGSPAMNSRPATAAKPTSNFTYQTGSSYSTKAK